MKKIIKQQMQPKNMIYKQYYNYNKILGVLVSYFPGFIEEEKPNF